VDAADIIGKFDGEADGEVVVPTYSDKYRCARDDDGEIPF
jgi:hypothetical protein